MNWYIINGIVREYVGVIEVMIKSLLIVLLVYGLDYLNNYLGIYLFSFFDRLCIALFIIGIVFSVAIKIINSKPYLTTFIYGIMYKLIKTEQEVRNE